QTVASIGYSYDLNDRMTGKTTTGTAGAADNTYGYDQAGRLTTWSDGTTTTNYAWDASGNRVQAGADTATFDQQDRLVSEGDTTYSYTSRGTVESKTSSGLADDFSFDAFDRLVNEGGTSYSYDGLDRPTSRNDQAISYDGTDSEPVSDGTATYARGPADELLAVAQGDTADLTLSDQHGDVVGDFDPSDTTLDALTDSAAYDPFGQVTATSDTTGIPGNVGYQGDWTDPDTGQVDMGARFYDPDTGTFDSRDTATYTTGASILANPFVYGAGDPLDNTDPTGNWPCFSCAFHAVTHAVSSAVHTAVHVASTIISTGWHYAVSAVRTVVHAIASAARWVYNKARAAIHAVAHAVSSAYNWVRSKAAAAYNWAKQRAAAARQAAVRAARAVTRHAKAAVAWAVKHNPIPAIAAAVKPLYTGLKKVISAAARIPAQVVAVTRNVVKDATKAVQVIYHDAVEAAGTVVQNVSKAVQATANFVEAHAATIAGIAAGAVVGIGCGLAIGWTGVGAVACAAAAGAVGSLVTDAVEGGHSWKQMAVDALVGGAFGALTGGLGSIGGAGLGAGARALVTDGAESAGRAALSAGRQEASNIVRGRISGGLGRNIARRALGSCTNSFTSGTGVLMANGSRRAIQDVRIGDRVIATDPITGKTAAEPVADVIVGHGVRRLVALTVAVGVALGGGGVAYADSGTHAQRTETITATEGHPFRVDGQGKPIGPDLTVNGYWSTAGNLRPGVWLDTPGGGHAAVLATRAYTTTTTVYNLTINGIHTFYAEAGDTPLLVHNDSCRAVTLLGRKADIEQYMANNPDGGFDADFLNIRGTMNNGKAGTGGWTWQRNKRFIDEALEGGNDVRLVTDPNKPLYSGGNTYQRELKYMQGRGYGWEEADGHWSVQRVRP
ncbi:MAG TPA: RHS repeat-associated core domain-containing protein, partial [Mycobacteriales bacterium]|nr:RHS repeat-associated core domain-containing protein [Mycobacteriales bacterium]